MPRDGSGNYTLPSGNPVVTNTVISSNGWANPTLSDIAAAITQSLSRDGQTTPTANLSMGNYRLMNLANGTLRTDAATVGQVQDNQLVLLTSVAGTGDAITAATAPAITALVTGQKFVFFPTASNTTSTPTIAIDGLPAITITQSNSLGLWSGAFVSGRPYELLYDGTNLRVQSGQLAGMIPITSSPFALRNRVIDGGFNLWSSGTSFNLGAAVSAYTADMYKCFTATGGAATISKGTFTPGTEPSGITTPGASYLFFSQTTAASSGNPFIAHSIESVYTLDGRSATFSCWLWTSSGTATISSLNVTQSFGSSGSTAVVTGVSVTWNLTTTPQRFSVRIDIPSITGKTVAGGNDNIAIVIALPGLTTFGIATTQWQLEDCPVAAPAAGLPTPFELRPFALDAGLAMRYIQVYPKTNGNAFAPAYATSTTQAFANWQIAPMRATPAFTSTATPKINTNTCTLSMADPNTALFSATGSFTTGSASFVNASANGNLIFDARY